MYKISLPKTGKIERTYKLKMFIDKLTIEENKLRTKADKLRLLVDKLKTKL